MNTKKIKINEENVGKRIDSLVPLLEEKLTRNAVQRLIEEENIKVNNQKTKHSYKVKLNDEIQISIPEAEKIDLKAQNIPLEIIYEDEDIIVVWCFWRCNFADWCIGL